MHPVCYTICRYVPGKSKDAPRTIVSHFLDCNISKVIEYNKYACILLKTHIVLGLLRANTFVSCLLVSVRNRCGYDVSMTRQDIRMANLRKLIAEFGSNSALANAVGTNEKYLSQLLNMLPLPSGNHRSLGDKLARRLERCSGKPDGWMDRDHDASIPVSYANLSLEENELLRLYREANTFKRRAIMVVARLRTSPE